MAEFPIQSAQLRNPGPETAGSIPRAPLRLLLVEDSQEDAELITRELRRGGYEPDVVRVETASEMTKALADFRVELVLSDHTLPTLSSLTAFALLRDSGRDLPFIIVSGTLGEDVAVEAMRAGVNDYLLKGNLMRLVPAVERELREAARRAEERKVREHLLISERMVSVGTLASGVAHEINNPLAVVMGNLDLMAADLAEATELSKPPSGESRRLSAGSERMGTALSRLRQSLGDAQEAAERVRVIVRDLRLFSRADDESRGPVDVCKILDSSLRMARNEIRHRARVVRKYGEVAPVDGNQARLGQVFLNLLMNAAQALPEGKTDEHTITVVARKTERHVVVEISDTGGGIPPEVLPRIFDMFFTTKPIGIGSGLGLAICHRIVTALGGEITVESRVGAGTTFRVTLPVAAGMPEVVKPVRAPLPPRAPAPVPRAKVLVVEDEHSVGRMLDRLLSSIHDVTVVNGGREALARLETGEKFDVVLCDLMMPEMTGMDFYDEVGRRDPELTRRFIFVTGGAFTLRAREFLESVPNPRIDKPVNVSQLQKLIADARAGRRAR